MRRRDSRHLLAPASRPRGWHGALPRGGPRRPARRAAARVVAGPMDGPWVRVGGLPARPWLRLPRAHRRRRPVRRRLTASRPAPWAHPGKSGPGGGSPRSRSGRVRGRRGASASRSPPTFPRSATGTWRRNFCRTNGCEPCDGPGSRRSCRTTSRTSRPYRRAASTGTDRRAVRAGTVRRPGPSGRARRPTSGRGGRGPSPRPHAPAGTRSRTRSHGTP